MCSLLGRILIISVAVIAILYQFVTKTIIFDTLGYGRPVSSITTFSNVQCQKVDELGLEACEDMWLHEPTGLLYMACSDSQSRTQWLPAVGSLNAQGRGLTDRVAILDTRADGPLSSRVKWITAKNFHGIKGDGTLNLHGMDIRADPHTDTLAILLVNHRPPFDPITRQPLDAAIVGANSTIELFQTTVGSDTMVHVRTFSNDAIQTPNDVAWVNDRAFVFTNDHSRKTGWRREFDAVIGGGSIGYCDQDSCNIAKDTDICFPNGIVRGYDGLFYAPSSITGEVKVLSLNGNRVLSEVASLKIPMPVDNLSVDKNGDIFAAGFPHLYEMTKSFKDPFRVSPPSAVFKFYKKGAGSQRLEKGESHAGPKYVVEKIMEDDGTVLPGASSAVHDAETGRIFLGGPMSPYITICETR